MGSNVLVQLLEKTKSCTSVGDLQALMEAEGVWLNDAAASQAFRALESERRRAGALNDAELACAVGGVGQPEPVPVDVEPLDHQQAEGILLDLWGMMSLGSLQAGRPTQMA